MANIGTIGCYPIVIAKDDPTATVCVEKANSFARQYDAALAVAIEKVLRPQTPGATILEMDYYAIFDNIQTRPASFGTPAPRDPAMPAQGRGRHCCGPRAGHARLRTGRPPRGDAHTGPKLCCDRIHLQRDCAYVSRRVAVTESDVSPVTRLGLHQPETDACGPLLHTGPTAFQPPPHAGCKASMWHTYLLLAASKVSMGLSFLSTSVFSAGFKNTLSCCGAPLPANALITCGTSPTVDGTVYNYTLCANPNNHIYWDFTHPSQATASIVAKYVWSGNTTYIRPFNVKELVSMR